ncbi:DUF5681 domain-containing protein [Azospirillum sp.]|uniref:DUF5681 domain-containing protein n=1 Tax=Azospirillum sp. TaxID=34012 RepID=UPI003D749207
MAAEKSAGKQRGRPFQKGQSGNPAGKPKGTRHKATLAAEALLDGEAEMITRKAIDMAKEGDSVALRLVLERVLPPRKERPVAFQMPVMNAAEDAAKAMAALVAAVAAGDLTPTEGSALAGMVETFRRTLETTELERRLAALEARTDNA